MTGFIESGYDPRDYQYKTDLTTEGLPSSYDYSNYINIPIKDQGNTSTCVPHSLSTVIETMMFKDNPDKLDIHEIYDKRIEKIDGMTIREAFRIIKKDGYNTKSGRVFLPEHSSYFRLNSEIQLKWSLVANGPCVLALPVRSEDINFWRGGKDMGGHAIACIGYDEDGFILQNSWGSNWGNCGRCHLPYSDLRYVIEAWGMD